MVFEFEGFPSETRLASILESLGAPVSFEKAGFVGNFPESNAFFVFTNNPSLEEIATDQMQPLGWEIGARLAVHCPVSLLEESAKELESLIAEMDKTLKARFLFSFQYESVYAVRDRELLVYKRMIE